MAGSGIGSDAVFDHGSNSDVDAAAEQLTTLDIGAAKGVLIKASFNNSGTVYVGKSDVTAATNDATDGMELGPGESVTIPVDNANKVYIIASVANQRVFWMTV